MAVVETLVAITALAVAQAGPVVQRPDPVAPTAPAATEVAPSSAAPGGALVPEPGATAPPTTAAPVVAPPPAATAPEPVAPEPVAPEPVAPEPVAPPDPEPAFADTPIDDTPDPEPLTDEELYDQSQIDGEFEAEQRRAREAARARTLIAAGALSGFASALMLVMAGVEANKPDCDFDRVRCDDAPRPSVARGLGIAGGILAVGGATMLGLGIRRNRRLRAGVVADDQSAALLLRGRF